MDTLVFNIKSSKKSELKKFLIQLGYHFETRPNLVWFARDEETALSLYKNNRLLLQGKDAKKMAEILKAGEFLIEPTPPKPETTRKQVKTWMGIDEAGKGDFFGPLVIAGFMVDEETAQDLFKIGVRDSKTLSDKSVIQLVKEIKKLGQESRDRFIWSIITINPKRYNELHNELKNINRILAWGHARAIENILKKKDCPYAISDKFGDPGFIEKALMQKGKKIIVEQHTKAESDIAVAAASIFARNEFIWRLNELSQNLGMELPKGVSEDVIKIGREIVGKFGAGKLSEVAKIHFKTTREILGT